MISIIIPTFNEYGNITSLVKYIYQILIKANIKFEIIIVDDNSPDQTALEIKREFKNNKNIRLFVRKRIKGLASAILYGIKKAKGKIIVGMDADFNHPPEKIITLVEEIKSHDLVIASRFIKGGGMEDKVRYFLTCVFNLLLKYILGFPTMDNMSGFYAIKKEKLSKLPIADIYRGYGEYHLRLDYLSKKNNLKIKETPVYCPERRYGQSKSNLFIMFFIYLWTGLKMKLKKID